VFVVVAAGLAAGRAIVMMGKNVMTRKGINRSIFGSGINLEWEWERMRLRRTKRMRCRCLNAEKRKHIGTPLLAASLGNRNGDDPCYFDRLSVPFLHSGTSITGS
jgi:hypothetical protein